MSEVTRVPLRPVSGTAKIWLALFVCLLGGAVIAGVSMPAMVKVTTEIAGQGPNPAPDQYVVAEITGQLDDGFVFQPRTVAPLKLNQVIPGFARALVQMQTGGSYAVRVPAELGYGSHAVGPVPANSALNFHVKVVEIASEDQLRQQEMMMERARRGAGGAGSGAPSGAPGPVQ